MSEQREFLWNDEITSVLSSWPKNNLYIAQGMSMFPSDSPSQEVDSVLLKAWGTDLWRFKEDVSKHREIHEMLAHILRTLSQRQRTLLLSEPKANLCSNLCLKWIHYKDYTWVKWDSGNATSVLGNFLLNSSNPLFLLQDNLTATQLSRVTAGRKLVPHTHPAFMTLSRTVVSAFSGLQAVWGWSAQQSVTHTDIKQWVH